MLERVSCVTDGSPSRATKSGRARTRPRRTVTAHRLPSGRDDGRPDLGAAALAVPLLQPADITGPGGRGLAATTAAAAAASTAEHPARSAAPAVRHHGLHPGPVQRGEPEPDPRRHRH